MKREPVLKPKPGDLRIVEKFFILPKKLMLKSNTDYTMTRWMEKGHIEQIYRDGKWQDRYWVHY